MSLGSSIPPEFTTALFARTALAAALILTAAACDRQPAPEPARAATSGKAERVKERQRVDTARDRAWVLNAEGVFLQDRRAGKKVAIELPGWQWIDRPYACLPDLALGPRGEVLVTSNVVSTLWRIDPDTLAVSVHPVPRDADLQKDVGFSGIVYSPQARAYFGVSDVHGSLWRIDPSFASARKLKVTASLSNACSLELHQPLVPGTGTDIGLCVRLPEGGKRIAIAADQQSASVGDEACAKRS